MIIYGDDSTRLGSDRACVRLNYRVSVHIACGRSKEVASFAQFVVKCSKAFYPSVVSFPSRASLPAKEKTSTHTISTATVRIPWSSSPLVFAPSSSSGSQAARHGRIPKPVLPRLVCSSPIPAWIRHCVPDVLGSRSPLFFPI
jgi:hypothetical protein